MVKLNSRYTVKYLTCILPIAVSSSNLSPLAVAFQFPGRKGATKTTTTTATATINEQLFLSDVPLVFIPGLKGTHLSYLKDERAEESFKKKKNLFNAKDMFTTSTRARMRTRTRTTRNNNGDGRPGPTKRRTWLTLSSLLNVPSLPNDHRDRSLALPLTYDANGVQDRGHLFPDGVIEHVIQLGKKGKNNNGNKSILSVELFPFYGHVIKHLEELDATYKSSIARDDANGVENNVGMEISQDTTACISPNHHHHHHGRPTAIFPYDWRRSISELSNEFDDFCEMTFPGQPVQVLAHSMGGLISYGAMRKNPDKYKPGGVFVGVPFGTGIQYLQDMHRGYFPLNNRCQQFTPRDQFTFSSHWIFLPTDKDDVGDSFVDVSDEIGVKFEAEKSSIGKPPRDATLQSTIKGEDIEIDFHNVQDWERLELGIFHPKQLKDLGEETLGLCRNHMKVQLDEAKQWRDTILNDLTGSELPDFPSLVLCATDSIPTVNQILRRKRQMEDNETNIEDRVWNRLSLKLSIDLPSADLEEDGRGSHEYDYINGRSVPGDGRIDFDKAFPYNNVPYKGVRLNSAHAKQMCLEDTGMLKL